MDFDTERFDHGDGSLGLCWIGDECPHVDQLKTVSDPVCFRFGSNEELGDEGTRSERLRKEDRASLLIINPVIQFESDIIHDCVLFVLFNS